MKMINGQYTKLYTKSNDFLRVLYIYFLSVKILDHDRRLVEFSAAAKDSLEYE